MPGNVQLSLLKSWEVNYVTTSIELWFEYDQDNLNGDVFNINKNKSQNKMLNIMRIPPT